jgi:hypothetical protein
VPAEGFEPPTTRLRSGCSTAELRRHGPKRLRIAPVLTAATRIGKQPAFAKASAGKGACPPQGGKCDLCLKPLTAVNVLDFGLARLRPAGFGAAPRNDRGEVSAVPLKQPQAARNAGRTGLGLDIRLGIGARIVGNMDQRDHRFRARRGRSHW